MRSDCVAAVTQAAAQMGRKLSATDLRGIEDLVTQKYKALAIADRNKFSKMTEVERLQEASEMAAGEVVHNAIKKRQRAELQLLRDAEFDVTFEHMIGKGMSPADAMERILFFRADGKGGITSLRSVINAQDAFWKSRLSDLWKMEHKNLINIFTDKKMQSDFVNELYGKDSGNAMAKKAAEGYKNLSEEIRQQMNEAGFDIRRLDDYRSPQKLSYWRVYQEAKTPEKRAAMVDEFMRNLDRSRYVEKDGSPMSDANLAKFVDEAIQTIITDGMNKKIAQGTGSIANRGSQARQLHWKDAESFIQMMDKYSETNIVDQIYGQIHQLATDLTLAKSFGPNVVHSFDTKMTKVMQDRNPAVIKKANKVQAMFDNLVGLNGEIANPTVHRAFNTARQMFSAALLGSNTITQMSDQSTLAMTARAMNVPVLKAFTEEAKFLADAGHRDLVRSMAGALDSMSNMIARVADQNSAGFWGNANNVLMQINLSAHMTNAVRAGYTAAAYSHYGSLAKRSFSDLKPIDRALLEAKGVNESMWNLLGKADLTEGQYLSPNDIKRISDADVFSAMPERRQAIFDQAKGIQEKMEAQNQKESGWLQNRQTKFAEYKDKIQKMIDDYEATRSKNVDKTGDEIGARLDVLKAMRDEADARVAALTGDVSQGVELGARVQKAVDGIREAKMRLSRIERKADKEVFAKATELEKRIDKRMAELEEFTGSITKRMESRQGIADEWQSKIGDKLSKEAENIRNDTMLKYLAMVLEESHMASLQPSDISSAFLKGSGKRGELPSEIMGLLTQFKSFPVAMMFQHVIDRGLMGGKGIANKNTYLASLALFSTITGGMALLLGDIAAGRDPRTIFDENDPMKLAKFGGQAMLKGGAFGAIADILNPQAYEGREPGISLFGPAVGFAVNAGQAAFAGGKMAVAYISDDGEEFSKQSRTLAAEGMQLAKSSIPFQNLWWIRAAFHNYFLNEIHEFMAPGYKDRLKGALEKNYGAEQWASPDGLRAPDFGNIVQQ